MSNSGLKFVKERLSNVRTLLQKEVKDSNCYSTHTIVSAEDILKEYGYEIADFDDKFVVTATIGHYPWMKSDQIYANLDRFKYNRFIRQYIWKRK